MSVRTQTKFALIGIGGIGKTQVAVQYAFASEQNFPVILWAHAETRAKLAESFSGFDKELGLTTAIISNQDDSIERVKGWLKRAGL
jgi:D-arabinose 1-dehydrogenase-like Zn-dependent alcohol dehydrogenase